MDELINVYVSSEYDRVFIKRGSEFKEYLDIVKEIHLKALAKELTDIMNLGDWLVMQFYLHQLDEKRKSEK